MTPTERRLLTLSTLIGAALTLLVLLLSSFGVLRPLDRWFYDGRFTWCRWFSIRPTDRLVHIDIDDPALETIDRWPWDRSKIAWIIDEIHRAGAKVIALDVLFPEPQQIRHVKLSDGTYTDVHDDQVLADVIKASGNVLVPVSLGVGKLPTDMERKFIEILTDDLEQDVNQAFAKVKSAGLEIPPPDERADIFVRARRRAMFARLNRFLDKLSLDPDESMPTAEQVSHELLPDESIYSDSPMRRLLASEYRRVQSVRKLKKFGRALPETLPPLVESRHALPPLPSLAQNAHSTGFVTHIADDDGVVRSIPLLIYHRGWVYPQFGLAMACAQLDVPMSDVRYESHRIVIPLKDGRELVIPVHTKIRGKQKHGMMLDLPWFGTKENWEYMYDYPHHRRPRQHLPINRIWDVHESRRRLLDNIANAEPASKAIYEVLDPGKLKTLEDNPIDHNDFETWHQFIQVVLNEIDESGFLPMFEEMQAAELDKRELVFIKSARSLKVIADENPRLLDQLNRGQTKLREDLEGRTALVGWTATASIADFVPTSLHSKCPGSVVHGVIFNGIMTQDLLRRLPNWVNVVALLMVGLISTLAASTLSPLRSLIACTVLGAGYVAVNGILLFDYFNIPLVGSGPVVAVLLVWGGCTLTRFVVERAERARITQRFRSYVDPVLVNYVIEHPEQDTLAGQVRELSVVFTDLQGFTTLSERLREQTVPLLQDYMGLMVPIIRRHRGYVNKFLGDGIMFFYGAPLGDDSHGAHAVRTALEMQDAMVGFNQDLTERGLPNVAMRVGISTGRMVVGDAGPADASDYTVLGDSVNLGARLESANKATDTRILMTERTTELLEDRFLIRPVAKLQVVGKEQSEMTYEAMAFADKANDEQRQLASLTREVVDAFVGAEFRLCLEHVERLATAFGPNKLTALYGEQCQHFLSNPPTNGFDGAIVLTAK